MRGISHAGSNVNFAIDKNPLMDCHFSSCDQKCGLNPREKGCNLKPTYGIRNVAQRNRADIHRARSILLGKKRRENQSEGRGGGEEIIIATEIERRAKKVSRAGADV